MSRERKKNLCKYVRSDDGTSIRFLCGGLPVSMVIHRINMHYNENHGEHFAPAQRTCRFFKSTPPMSGAPKSWKIDYCAWTDSMATMCECPEAIEEEELMLGLDDL